MNLRRLLVPGMLAAIAAMPCLATVNVLSPTNGVTVNGSVHYAAVAASNCGQGVAAMGIYVDNKLVFSTPGTTIDTSLQFAPGTHNTYVQQWDYCGGSDGTAVQVSAKTQQGGVFVSAPAENSTVAGSVTFVASATSGCGAGIAAMGVYVNDRLIAVAKGASFNEQLCLGAGAQKTVIQAWDNCGGSATKQIDLTVQGASPAQAGLDTAGVYDLQAAPNWNQWGELAPVYDVCSPCGGVSWNMSQHVSSPSLSGNATRFDIGGSVPYSDVLWSNKIIGDGSTKNLPDKDRNILPNIQNLQYDVDVFVTNWAVTQDLEFDVNIYMNGVGQEWGTECNHLADGAWDIWDNVSRHWIATNAPCSLNSNAWNHITLSVQRLPDSSLLYKAITVNGTTFNINRTSGSFSVPSGWYGMTVNFQMDGNYQMAANTTFVDNLNIRYW